MIPEQRRPENSVPQCNWSFHKREITAMENANFSEILSPIVPARPEQEASIYGQDCSNS
jgi:hypothetical protein